jgi:hypothetical protein
MKITRPHNRALVISDFPYLIGAVAFPVAAFLLYQAVKAFREGDRTRDVVGASIAAVLFFFAGAVFTQRTRFEFDLAARHLRWSRRGLFNRAGGDLPFDQIRHALVQTSNSSDGATARVVLLLADDSQLPLTRAYDADTAAAERARIAINEALSATPTTPEDDIRNLALAGQKLRAIRLARIHYGYDLAQATQFVESLMSK